MRYYVKFIPVGERNAEPPASRERRSDDLDFDGENPIDILWRQLADSCLPLAIIRRAAEIIKGEGER